MILKARVKFIVPACVVIAVVSAIYAGLYFESVWYTGLTVFTIIGAYVIDRYNFLAKAYQLLVFSLPLSYELSVFGGAKIIFPSEYMALLVGISLVFRVGRSKKLFSRLKDGLVWLIPLVLVILLGTVLSTQLIISLKYSSVYLLYIWVFAAGMYLNGQDQFVSVKNLFTVYSIAYGLVVLWAIYHWSTYSFNPVTIPKIFEPFYADHTIFGASGVILLLFWLVELFKRKLLNHKLDALAFAAIAFLGVAMSSSRAAFLSIPVGLVVFIIVKMGFRKRHLVFTAFSLSMALFVYRQDVVNLIEYNNYNSRDEHANLLERTASVANVQTDVSNVERINRWAAAINMFKEKPFFGFGPGVFQFAYIPYQDERFKNRLTVEDVHHIPKNSGGTVHSELFLYLSELGLFGLAAFIFFVFGCIWLVLSKEPKNRSATLVVCFALMSTYFFHGLFNNFLNTDKFAFLFWGAAGTFLSEFKK